jgi:hypothetical protein
MDGTTGHLEGVVIKLDVGAFQRLGDGLLGTVAALTWYLLGGFFVGVALRVSAFDLWASVLAWPVAIALAVVAFGLGRWGRRRVRRGLNLDTRLIVQVDCLVIRHGALLPEPLVIPKEAVSVAAVDASARASARHSLAVAAEGGTRRLTWLWERYSKPPVPVLGLATRAPNLAVLLDRPIDGVPEGGLLLRVRDPAAASSAFAGWNACRELTGDDLARVRALR